MGGYGSGRHSPHGTTERAVTLDMAECMKMGQLCPGAACEGRLTSRNSLNGDVVASAAYLADMRDPEAGWLHLTYSTTRWGETTQQSYRVLLTTTRPHFGGRRWWFCCPVSHRRVRCLHLAGSSAKFASREHLQLGYQCQRETWSDRRLRAARSLETRLGTHRSEFDDVPSKPKWMRWPTYRCLVREWERASEAHMVSSLAALGSPLAAPMVEAAFRDDPGLFVGSGLL